MEESESSLEYACAHGKLASLLEEYIASCREAAHEGENTVEKRQSKKNKSRFVNIAGFCRYLNIGNAEFDALCEKYPDEFDKLKAVFEDEAFNSDVSPTLLSAYLKKRLGYEKNKDGELFDGQLKVVFDQDFLEDGQ